MHKVPSTPRPSFRDPGHAPHEHGPVSEPVVRVPDVVGWEPKPGFEAIRKEGLLPKFADKNRSGKITQLNPPAGTRVRPGTAVWVWVSTPPRLVRVPDIVGLERQRGFAALTKVGLVGRVVRMERSNRHPREIIQQRPPARTLVERGSEVSVWVASGPTLPWPIILAAAAVVYLLVKIVKKLFWPVRVELCPVLDSGDQKLEKVVPLVAAGAD